MPKSPSSRRKTPVGVWIALITTVGAIATAIFASPVLIALIQRTPPPTTAPTDTPAPTLVSTATTTSNVATSTSLPISTVISVLTPTLIAGGDFQLGCIDSKIWMPYRGEAHSKDENGCWQLKD